MVLRPVYTHVRFPVKLIYKTGLQVFATLSPIPGYGQWLLSKLASSEMSGSVFKEKLLKPEEEKALMDASG